MKLLLLSFLIIALFFGITPSIYAQSVPDWVKNTAGWWSADAISEGEFVNAIEFLINGGIIEVETKQSTGQSQGVPDWVKNTAGWWSADAISEGEFVNAIEFLINGGIIEVDNTCIFEINHNFKAVDKKIIEKLCDNDYDLKFTELQSIRKVSDVKINEFGFRGPEIKQIPEPNTYRVFTIGGSTMFSQDNLENETIAYHLQEKFNSSDLSIKIEVINAGMPGAWSESEKNLIKEKLINFQPDLFLVLDGWNDHSRKVVNRPNSNENTWRDNWIDVCELGNKKGFDTVVTLQPLVGTGNRLLTDQELKIFTETWGEFVGSYEKYAQKLNDIGKYCTATKDLRNIYDYSPYPIFFDEGHKNSKGNEIIANEFFKLTIPILNEKHGLALNIDNYTSDENNNYQQIQIEDSILDYSYQVITDKDFSNKDLKNANFEGTVMKNIDFSNSKLEGTNFRFSDMDKIIFKDANLENADISRAAITNSDFTNANVKDSKIFGSVLYNVNLKKTNLENVNFQTSKLEVIFDNSILKNSDVTSATIKGCNLKNSFFDNMLIKNTIFFECNFKGTDLSRMNFDSNNKFPYSYFENTIFPNELFNTDFSPKTFSNQIIPGAFLVGINFQNTDIKNIIFSLEKVDDMLENILNDKNYSVKVENYLKNSSSNMIKVDFSNKELSNKNLSIVNFYEANFSNTDLSNSDLRFSNLTNSNLKNANLEGANLEGANLNCINHEICTE